MRTSFILNDEIVERAKKVVSKNPVEYRNLTHFIELAMKRLIELEESEVKK